MFQLLSECQLPEFGFLDDELEQLRLKLCEAVEKLTRAIGLYTFPFSEKPGSDLQGVPREWEYRRREQWDLAVSELNQFASECYEAYVTLIKTARRRLAV